MRQDSLKFIHDKKGLLSRMSLLICDGRFILTDRDQGWTQIAPEANQINFQVRTSRSA